MAYKTPKQLENGYINNNDVLEAYKKMKEEFGRPTLGRVRDYLTRKGVKNPYTGNPPTRQAIFLSLQKSEEGRKLLAETSHKHFLTRPAWGWPEEREERDRKRAEITVPEVGL